MGKPGEVPVLAGESQQCKGTWQGTLVAVKPWPGEERRVGQLGISRKSTAQAQHLLEGRTSAT